jgi:hypothetical protein
MLMLIKPWRQLHKLKKPIEMFKDVYDIFISQADKQLLRVIANVQYYYKCSDGAKAQ